MDALELFSQPPVNGQVDDSDEDGDCALRRVMMLAPCCRFCRPVPGSGTLLDGPLKELF